MCRRMDDSQVNAIEQDDDDAWGDEGDHGDYLLGTVMVMLLRMMNIKMEVFMIGMSCTVVVVLVV
jgi:hypothetical protein